MSRRVSLGDFSTDAAATTQLRAPILPAGSIPRRAPLESSKLSETVLDIAFVVGGFLCASITALGFVWAMFVCFFVKL